MVGVLSPVKHIIISGLTKDTFSYLVGVLSPVKHTELYIRANEGHLIIWLVFLAQSTIQSYIPGITKDTFSYMVGVFNPVDHTELYIRANEGHSNLDEVSPYNREAAKQKGENFA